VVDLDVLTATKSRTGHRLGSGLGQLGLLEWSFDDNLGVPVQEEEQGWSQSPVIKDGAGHKAQLFSRCMHSLSVS